MSFMFWKQKEKMCAEDEPWQIKAARYCVEHDTFSSADLVKYIVDELGQGEEAATRFIEENIQDPPGTRFQRTPVRNVWFAPTELVSMITDYDELKEARGNAKEAWRMALWALIVGGIGALFQAFDFVLK